MEKLEKCPFCGGKVQMFSGVIANLPMIVCSQCGATVSFGGKEKPKLTAEAWNRRTKNEH